MLTITKVVRYSFPPMATLELSFFDPRTDGDARW
jgi:hypothetical protein